MPYIQQDRREKFDAHIDALSDEIEEPGDLTYVLFTLVLQAWIESDRNYAVLAALMGALACTKEEFYRRVGADYEDEKIELNGDVVP